LQRAWRSEQDCLGDRCHGYRNASGELDRASSELGRIRGRGEYGEHVCCRHL
jgi:hypothetical protein